MLVNQLIVYIMAFFLLLGAIDRCLNNRFGLGKNFNEGILATSALIVPTVGFICTAPVIGSILSPIVSPIFIAIGSDPSMFAGLILSSDMGGYPLAMNMAQNQQIGEFSGIIVASVLGGSVCFAIPVLLSSVRETDRESTSMGLMIGIIAMPLGCLIGGIIANFDTYLLTINLIPIIILSITLIVGLWRFQKTTIKAFILFSRLVLSFATLMFALAGIQEMTKTTIIPGVLPIADGFIIVGAIAIVLAGAYPLIAVINRFLARPLARVSLLIGINSTSCAALLAVLANFLPIIPMIKDMGDRGRIIVMAFLINAGAALGDYTGFTVSVAEHMLLPMIAAKLCGGLIAIIIAIFFCNKMNISTQTQLKPNKPVLVNIADYK